MRFTGMSRQVEGNLFNLNPYHRKPRKYDVGSEMAETNKQERILEIQMTLELFYAGTSDIDYELISLILTTITIQKTASSY
jgi:hypothetical protein